MKIPITKVVIDDEDLAAVQEPLKTGWLVQGPFVKEFEERFAAFTGARHAVACTSCTTGLHLALAALDIKAGDEVIVPAYTWVATANVVKYQGADVVFCDVDLKSYNIDVADLERKLSARTKAIIPVHLFGLSAEMSPILELAKSRHIHVVEDAACGFGSTYRGRHVGTLGDFGSFSFHPRKSVTTGEGGMVTTQDEEYAALLRSLRDHGSAKSDLARHEGKAAYLLSQFNILGFNYRMTDLQGALGVSQMQKAESILSRRIARAERYLRLLQGIDQLQLPQVGEDFVHSFQSFVCLYAPQAPTLENVDQLHAERNALMQKLENMGIATRQGTHAVTDLEYYKRTMGIEPRDYPNALLADRLTMTLPLYAEMTDEEQDYVVQHVRDFLGYS